MPSNQVRRTCLATLVVFGSCLGQPNSSSGRPARVTPKTAVPPAPALSRQSSEILGGLPLVFEPNLGQADPQVRFLTRAAGMTSLLTDQGSVMMLSRRKDQSGQKNPHNAPQIEQTVVRMRLEGSRATLRFEGQERAESVSRYFIGNDPSKWAPNVPNYRRVRAHNVYAGIDLIYYGDGRKLEYDFVVKPGADPNQIRLAYHGADTLKTNAQGDLLIATRLGTLIQRRPKVYQEFGGERREIEAAYSIKGSKVEFALADWDRQKELVIDPVLEYSTYLGGSADDYGKAIAVDASGATYVTGQTSGTFPNAGTFGGGPNDAFVTKLSASGTLIYSTYLGGTGNDFAQGIALGANGEAYVAGGTTSDNFPTTGGVFQTTFGGVQDAFVTKLSESGTLAYSTYLGGPANEKGWQIAVDSSGVYVVGFTYGQFPTTPGAYQETFHGVDDVFVTKLKADLTGPLIYSTYLGGSGEEEAYAIAIDQSGAAYVTGFSQSADFPYTPGAFQPPVRGLTFVTKLNATGTALVYSANVGGIADEGDAIAVNGNGEAYVTGKTVGGMPITAGAYQTAPAGSYDAYVAKLSADGTSLIYCTYLGGDGLDFANGIAVDASGLAYVVGTTYSDNFPTTAGAYQTTPGGGGDAFVTKLNALGTALDNSTYLGGAGSDWANAVAVTSGSVAYVTGWTSGSFPLTDGALQPALGGGIDAFVTKLDMTTTGPPAAITVTGGGLQSTTVGAAFGSPLQVKVTDALGNPVSGVTVTFTAPSSSSAASATLSTTTASTDSSGLASVTAIANTVAGAYTVTATAVGVTPPATFFRLANLVGPAQTIAFVQQPSPTTQAGSPIQPPVTVRLQDEYHNPIIGTTITLSIPGGPAIAGATADTDRTGIATFSALVIQKAGTYQLQASDGGLTTLSTFFTITANLATLSIKAISGSDQMAVVGKAYTSPLMALVEDSLHNPIQGASVAFFAVPSSGGASVSFGSSATVMTDTNGLATSPTMTANGQAGSFQVTASTTGAATSATFSLTNMTGPANQLAFMQQPTDTAAGATIAPPVTVQIEDSFNNAVHTANIQVTLQVSPIIARLSGPLSFAAQLTDANGLATFPSLSISQVGRYELLAESSGIASATSNPFNIHAGTASKITATAGTPQSALVQTVYGEPLQVTVTDTAGIPVSGVPVVFTAPASGPSGSFGGQPTITVNTDAQGHAAPVITANSTAGPFAVTASSTALSGTASFALTNLPVGSSSLAFVQQPADTPAGATISPVVVRLTDGGGNPVPHTSVTLSLAGSTAILGGSVTTNTDASGQATFGDLSITTAGSYRLMAVSGSITAVSNVFVISATQSSVLITVFDGDGQSAAVGSAYGAPLRAMVKDLYGNVLTGVAVTFAPPASGASVTFSVFATVTTDAIGMATSPAMTANSQSGAFQVSANTTGAASPAVFPLTNIAATANRLTFVQQPTDTLAGAPITPAVTVQLQDASGNSVHTAGVAIALQSNVVVRRLHLLSGSATQNTDANGLATFAGLSITQVGAYTLDATSSGVASATSNPVNVTAGPATAILATGGTPQNAIIQTVYAVPLQATVTDTGNNPVIGVPVVFAAPTSGASGFFGGQPTITVNTDLQGNAQAVITANSITGIFGVTASSTAITGSASFDLRNLPAGSSSLAFVQQPSNTAAGQIIAPPVTVQVRDGSGNAMQVAGIPVFVSLSSGTGALFGSVVQFTDATGLATFNDLKIGTVGTMKLRAVSQQQAPVDSNTFQITAGAPASIAVFSGSPQATTVSQQFPALLQARVTDIAGNPVSGVSVTFLPAATGPSGTFSGPGTVATDANGIATAPPLTANSSPGNFVVTATAAGVSSPAVFALANLPQQSSAAAVTPHSLAFLSEINQAAPAGQVVQIVAGGTVTWTASSSDSWLTALPATGTGSGRITVSVNPAGLSVGNYSGFIRVTDSSGGVNLVQVIYTIADKPALVIAPPVLVFSATSNTISPAAQTLRATSSSRTIAYSVSVTVSTPTGGNWLQVSTSQGQTPGTVTVTANPANLGSGVYDGTVRFTPTDNTLNSVALPVTLIVGCGQGGCQLQPAIIAIVNAASFQPGGVPRAVMTIFGTNLSDGIYTASSYPLPVQLGPTSVTVNGMAAPVFYASPTQINFQMPGGSPTSVQVVVNNQATQSSRALRASQGSSITLATVHPGLFVTPDKRAAALNGDLSMHTAATPIPAGGFVILFATGEGPVTPPVPDGAPAPLSPLSIIDAPVQVTVGGKSAQVTYQGVAPTLAGLSQINAIVPPGLTPGDQPVFITINGVASNSGVITVK